MTQPGNQVVVHRDGLFFGTEVEAYPANNVKYVGRSRTHTAALDKPCWQIIKYTFDGSIVRSAYGEYGKYSLVWEDRESYFTVLLPDPPAGPDFPGEINVTGTFTPTGLETGGLFTRVTVDDTGWTAMPPTPLLARNELSIQNLSGVSLMIQHEPGGVAPTPAIVDGFTLPTNFSRNYAIKDTIQVYCRCMPGDGPVTIEVEELA